jgi:hypothetical protein
MKREHLTFPHRDGRKEARDMSIVIECLRRLREEPMDHLELVYDPKGLMGRRLTVKPTAPMATLKDYNEWEENRKKMYLHLATSLIRKHLLSWWT